MIQKIQIMNFQSHKDSVLELHPGVNSIIGSSNSGKSAILRGLFWVVYNRPTGVACVSHWNRDKHGNPKNPTAVKVQKNSYTLQRSRTKDFNGYEYGVTAAAAPEILEAIGTEVPEQITSLFNFTEVNISKQMDAPFLLSESSGEVARFFNKIIRLDLIDRVLSTAESKRKSIKKEIESQTALQTSLNNQLNVLSWTDIAEKTLNKCLRVNERLAVKKESFNDLFATIETYTGYEKLISDFNWIGPAEESFTAVESLFREIALKQADAELLGQLIKDFRTNREIIALTPDTAAAEKLIVTIEEAQKTLNQKESRRMMLRELVLDYIHLNKDIETAPDTDAAEKLLNQIISLKAEITKKEKVADALYEDIEEWTAAEEAFIDIDVVLTELQLQLPDSCPLCGSPIKKEVIK